DLVRPVVAAAQLGDAALVDVEAGGFELAGERNRERQPDVAKTNDDDTRSPGHWSDYNCLIRFGHTSTETDELNLAGLFKASAPRDRTPLPRRPVRSSL